ncbi:hypothetical protein EPUL_002308, partial [Erysiphe pulchra]
MSSLLNKLSAEAQAGPSSKPDESQTDIYEGIVIGGIIFATPDDVKSSVKESAKKSDICKLSEKLTNIEKISPLPTLKSSNWRYWYESVQRLLMLTETSAAFLPTPPRNKVST